MPPPVAHRGDSARAPENTLPAFRKALRLGVQRLELDVRFTADGTPVLMHDPAVDRTTDGSGEIESMALSDVRELDAGSWFSAEYAGVKVPTLYQEVLDLGRTRLRRPSPTTRSATCPGPARSAPEQRPLMID